MSFLAAIPVIGDILAKILGVVDKAVEDKDAANRLKAEIQSQILALDFSALEKEIDARANILVAELKGESWTQRNWRPLMMLCIIAIIANNYLIAPYMQLFGLPNEILVLPDRMWGLLEIGVGGYIIGRSGEKIVTKWKEKVD